jgi:hypothetical protein
LIPALFFDKQDLFHGPPILLLVLYNAGGIAVIGFAGGLRSKT